MSTNLLLNEGQRLPTLRESHRWWQHDPKGKLIIDYFSSPKHIPSLEDAQPRNLQKLEFGSFSDSNIRNASRDVFLDPCNDVIFEVDLTTVFADGSKHSQGLPLSLIREVCLNKTFRPKLIEANFFQALTAMDYLRDLECSRKSNLRDAAVRLKFKEENWMDALSADENLKRWIENIQLIEPVADEFYASSFIDLRIWVGLHLLNLYLLEWLLTDV